MARHWSLVDMSRLMVVFHKKYMYIVDSNTRNIYISARHLTRERVLLRRVPQQPTCMKQILQKATHFVGVSLAPKVKVLGNK